MTVLSGVVARFKGGGPGPTYTSAAAITAGRLVEITANRTVQMAGAASIKVVGVAKQGCDAVGDKIAVESTGVWNLLAVGAIAAGDKVIAAANGQVSTVPVVAATAQSMTETRAIVGIALEAIAGGQQGPVMLGTVG